MKFNCSRRILQIHASLLPAETCRCTPEALPTCHAAPGPCLSVSDPAARGPASAAAGTGAGPGRAAVGGRARGWASHSGSARRRPCPPATPRQAPACPSRIRQPGGLLLLLPPARVRGPAGPQWAAERGAGQATLAVHAGGPAHLPRRARPLLVRLGSGSPGACFCCCHRHGCGARPGRAGRQSEGLGKPLWQCTPEALPTCHAAPGPCLSVSDPAARGPASAAATGTGAGPGRAALGGRARGWASHSGIARRRPCPPATPRQAPACPSRIRQPGGLLLLPPARVRGPAGPRWAAERGAGQATLAVHAGGPAHLPRRARPLLVRLGSGSPGACFCCCHRHGCGARPGRSGRQSGGLGKPLWQCTPEALPTCHAAPGPCLSVSDPAARGPAAAATGTGAGPGRAAVGGRARGWASHSGSARRRPCPPATPRQAPACPSRIRQPGGLLLLLPARVWGPAGPQWAAERGAGQATLAVHAGGPAHLPGRARPLLVRLGSGSPGACFCCCHRHGCGARPGRSGRQSEGLGEPLWQCTPEALPTCHAAPGPCLSVSDPAARGPAYAAATGTGAGPGRAAVGGRARGWASHSGSARRRPCPPATPRQAPACPSRIRQPGGLLLLLPPARVRGPAGPRWAAERGAGQATLAVHAGGLPTCLAAPGPCLSVLGPAARGPASAAATGTGAGPGRAALGGRARGWASHFGSAHRRPCPPATPRQAPACPSRIRQPGGLLLLLPPARVRGPAGPRWAAERGAGQATLAVHAGGPAHLPRRARPLLVRLGSGSPGACFCCCHRHGCGARPGRAGRQSEGLGKPLWQCTPEALPTCHAAPGPCLSVSDPAARGPATAATGTGAGPGRAALGGRARGWASHSGSARRRPCPPATPRQAPACPSRIRQPGGLLLLLPPARVRGPAGPQWAAERGAGQATLAVHAGGPAHLPRRARPLLVRLGSGSPGGLLLLPPARVRGPAGPRWAAERGAGQATLAVHAGGPAHLPRRARPLLVRLGSGSPWACCCCHRHGCGARPGRSGRQSEGLGKPLWQCTPEALPTCHAAPGPCLSVSDPAARGPASAAATGTGAGPGRAAVGGRARGWASHSGSARRRPCPPATPRQAPACPSRIRQPGGLLLLLPPARVRGPAGPQWAAERGAGQATLAVHAGGPAHLPRRARPLLVRLGSGSPGACFCCCHRHGCGARPGRAGRQSEGLGKPLWQCTPEALPTCHAAPGPCLSVSDPAARGPASAAAGTGVGPGRAAVGGRARGWASHSGSARRRPCPPATPRQAPACPSRIR